jgi:hypothetical protein
METNMACWKSRSADRKPDDHLYLDLEALAARGWTRAYIERFLGSADRREPAKHWANFTGKSFYYLGRIQTIESSDEYRTAFDASLSGRRVSAAMRRSIQAKRRTNQDAVERFERTLTNDERRIREIIDRAASLLYELRARGYRTPHKA